jgi:hypothetical protein
VFARTHLVEAATLDEHNGRSRARRSNRKSGARWAATKNEKISGTGRYPIAGPRPVSGDGVTDHAMALPAR